MANVSVPATGGVEALFLGRGNVSGAADATALAMLVQRLQSAHPISGDERRVTLLCYDKELRVDSPRRDEGFESDDSESLRSGSDQGSWSLPETPVPNKCRDSDDTSSANSSASDSEEIDGAEAGGGSGSGATRTNERGALRLKASYAIEDIVFCHTDEQVVVWVVRTRGGPTATADSSTALEALAFQCRSTEIARDLFKKYHEVSQRHKLDRYRHPRRKGIADWTRLVSNQNNANAKKVEPTASIVSIQDAELIDGTGEKSPSRWNLVERTDSDGVRHLEVSSSGVRTSVLSSIVDNERIRSKVGREIEGVLLDVSDAQSNKDSVRHRMLLQAKNKESVPTRPDRGRYLNKSGPPVVNTSVSAQVDPANPKVILVPIKNESATRRRLYPKEPHVVRGELVRVLVTPTTSPSSLTSTGSPHQAMSWWCVELTEGRRSGLASSTQWPPTHMTLVRPVALVSSSNNSRKEPQAVKFSQKLRGLGEVVKSRWISPASPSSSQASSTTTAASGAMPKPVMKKLQRKEREQKKVTFNAYATVQVMD